MLGIPPDLRDKVTVMPDGCWRWTGTITTGGYGQVQIGCRKFQAHRVIYERLVGAITDGLHLDHLCRHRWCVRPDHLEPVEPRENVMRGIVPSANRRLCKAGRHVLTAAGIYRDSDGVERCRECRLESKRAWRARQRSRTPGG